MAYRLEGQLLEVCDCNVLCPCWIGEDPDNGTCEAINAYMIESGVIDGIDVSGLTVAVLVHVPGNILEGNWRVVLCVDERASEEQQAALVETWSGKRGGPLADVYKLVGEIVGVERAPIRFLVEEGKGTISIGTLAEAEMTPYRGPTGVTTTLNESIFTTIPGAPAWVSKASMYRRRSSHFGLRDMDLQGHNAIQGTFRFAA